MNKIEAHRDCGSRTKQRRRVGARAASLVGLTMLVGSVLTGQAFADPGQEGEQGNKADKVTLCHATGSETNPYSLITISENGLHGHDDHEGDIIPAPAGGCPGPETEPAKVTLCHATGSETSPYSLITISENGLNGHDDHEGDIIPAPAGGCPGPETEPAKVTLCHATGSETSPYSLITISENGLHGHEDHEGDIIPAPAGGCPGPTTTTTTPTTITTVPTIVTTAPVLTTAAPIITTTVAAGLQSTGGATPIGATVRGLTLEAPTTVASPPARVLGATLERSGGSLPRTGSGLAGLATFGLGLLVLGAALKLGSRPTQTSVHPAGS